MASIPPEEVEYQTSHFYEDESGSLAAFFTVCIVVTLLCMVSRTTSRLLTNVGMKADDWTLLIGAVIAEGSFVVLMIYAFNAGLGRHWETLSPDERRLFPKLNYAYNILNVSCYPIIKISILLLYLRVFVMRKFQLVTLACVAFVAMVGISNALVAVFACTPIQGFYDPSVSARCIDSPSFYWANASLNVVTDILILVVPIPVVWRLQMSTRRKIGITLLFLTGGLTFVLSILRIVYYVRFNPYDPSYSFIGAGYSTPGEVTLGVICACAPTWKPLSRRLIEIARSRFSSLRSSRTYHDVEQEGGTTYVQSSGNESNGGGRHKAASSVDWLPLQRPNLGQSHGIYEAKQNGLPETKTAAYRSRSGQESPDGSDGTPRLPIQGIKVKREVTVQQNGSRPSGN